MGREDGGTILQVRRQQRARAGSLGVSLQTHGRTARNRRQERSGMVQENVPQNIKDEVNSMKTPKSFICNRVIWKYQKE